MEFKGTPGPMAVLALLLVHPATTALQVDLGVAAGKVGMEV